MSSDIHNWPIFPVAKSKRPLIPGGFKEATTDPEVRARWQKRWPGHGIGVPTGSPIGAWVLDIDGHEGRMDLADLELEHGMLPPTLTSKTGGGGLHFFFRLTEEIRCSAGRVSPRIDVRGDGGYVVVPPSEHESGLRYEWQDTSDIADPPQWLIDLVTKKKEVENRPESKPVKNNSAYAAAALASECGHIRDAPEGCRNDQLNRSAFVLARFIRDGTLTSEVVKHMLTSAATDAGLEQEEISKTIKSAIGVGSGGGGSESACKVSCFLPDASPMRVAEAWLATQRDSKGRLMLRRWRGEFYCYDGSRYVHLPTEALKSRLWCWADGIMCGDADSPKKYSPSIAKIDNVLAAIIAMRVAGDSDLQPPHWCAGRPTAKIPVSCSNGIVDVSDGQLHESSPNFFTLSAAPCSYSAAAQPGEWLAFLNGLWPDDPGSINLLQEWFGYCLSGETGLQKMLVMIGPPRSGKGTIAYVLGSLLGAGQSCGPTLASLSSDFGLAEVADKSLAIIGDARVSRHADREAIVERLLAITGEDLVSVNRKYRAPFSGILPTRIMIMSNETPSLSEASGALAARMLFLRMRESHIGSEDTGLRARLISDLQGVLSWSLEGARRLFTSGSFTETSDGKSEAEAFREVASPAASFVEDRCLVSDAEWIDCARLYEEWKEWCVAEGLRLCSSPSFGRQLRAAVPSIRRVRGGAAEGRMWRYSGITLRSAF